MKLSVLGLFAVSQLVRVSGDSSTQVLDVKGFQFELDPTVQHVPLDASLQHLRPPPAHIPETFDIFIGSSVFRDAYRCGKTFFSALSCASHPERLRLGLIEQVYEEDGRCIDEYCKLAEDKWPGKGSCPYKSQIQVETHSAAEARGCTTARHLQQKLIGDEEFCLQVDAHSYFIKGWDERIVEDWSRIDNEMAVLTTYPYEAYDFVYTEKIPSFGSYPHLCSYLPFGNGKVRYPRSATISNYQTPQMGALWGGGLSFGKCHAEKNVPVDPHMPWLWEGEEFLRSAILWTHGYDLYSPSERGSVVFHNYTKNSDQRSWISAVDKETKELEAEKSVNRYRLQVEVAFDGPVNTFELSEYSFGNARSYREYLEFSNVSFSDGFEDVSPCR
jgi:hypothetical protein